MNKFFNEPLAARDPDMMKAITHELGRQREGIELIASENYVSRAVLETAGTVLTNKYAEGYPGKRYYGGCWAVDEAENLTMERAKKLFGCAYANVQPHSGSTANQAVFLALLNPGDTILGLSLDQGGHLTHGHKANMSGKWFKAEFYGVRQGDELIDYDALEKKAREVKPKLISAGASAYPRVIDFARMHEIARSVGAYFMADIAHIAGLVATGAHPSPIPYADVVTTTTHKTLRGPRGGMILSNNPELGKKFNSAVFPGLQGGPLMHIVAAKGVAFGEALQPTYAAYIKAVVNNCRVMGEELTKAGLRLVSGGTDNHLLLVDLRPYGLTGDVAEKVLEEALLTCNKNMVPFDTQSAAKTSGIRLGSAAGTTRGFGEAEFRQIGRWIGAVLASVRDGNQDAVVAKVRGEVAALCAKFPIYGDLPGMAKAA
ncbi:MAG: serine hydroxymethyltransferase [Proteobacteria bacterium]|nr:serine hydroxymethyltransferase [Pseudomonadota bacterium]NBX86807.1 serine hydroxymethyltransferase [Pseudomonadota bacterium]